MLQKLKIKKNLRLAKSLIFGIDEIPTKLPIALLDYQKMSAKNCGTSKKILSQTEKKRKNLNDMKSTD